MPEMPAAPAAPSAPAAPAAAAPTPAVPSTPATPAAPVSTPVAPEVSAAPAAPAVAPAAASKPEPKQSDFPGDIEAFLNAHTAWEREGGVHEEPPAENPEGQAPPEGEQAPASEEQPKEEVEPQVQPEAPEATPESLAKLITDTPGFKEFLDGAPLNVKGTLFQMARQNAKAAPILEIVPNVEAARFAADTSNRFVTHRTNFLEALDNPGTIGDAYAQFAEEFAERDDKGAILTDETGNPIYGEDFHALNNHVVDSYHDLEIEELEATLADKTASEEDREAAEMTLMAFKHIKDFKAGKGAGPKKPNLDGLTPEAKAYFEQKDAELNAEREKLGLQKKEQTSDQRKAERAAFDTTVERRIGGGVGSRLKNMIADDEKAGVYIPSYVTETKDPETGVSVFAQTMLDKFQESTYGRIDRKTGRVVGGVAAIRDKVARLSKLPPSKENEEARVKYALELIDEFLPAIYEKEKRSVQTKDINDRQRRQGNVDARRDLTTPEPRGGAAVQPKSLDPHTAMQEAYKWVDETSPDLQPWERTAKALVKKDELLSGRR